MLGHNRHACILREGIDEIPVELGNYDLLTVTDDWLYVHEECGSSIGPSEKGNVIHRLSIKDYEIYLNRPFDRPLITIDIEKL